MGNVYSTFCKICPINPPPELLRSQIRAEDSDGGLAQFTWSARGRCSELQQPAPPPPQPLSVSSLGSPSISQSKESACSSSVNPEVSRWSFLSLFLYLFFNLLLLCVGGGWGTLPQHPCGGQRTPLKSQFSPSTLGSGDGIQVTRLVNKHRTILPASLDLYGSLLSPWVDIFLAPKASLFLSIMYNFSHGFHSEWLSWSICYDSISKMGYDLGCCLGS